MKSNKYLLLLASLLLVLIGLIGGTGTIVYTLFLHEKSLTRFKVPGVQNIHFDKGAYLFSYEYKSFFEGEHYDLPVSLIDTYEVQLFDEDGKELKINTLKGNTSYREKTWRYNREAISIYAFDVPTDGMYTCIVTPKIETSQDIVCSVHKDISFFRLFFVGYMFFFFLFVGAILFLIWLMSFFLFSRANRYCNDGQSSI